MKQRNKLGLENCNLIYLDHNEAKLNLFKHKFSHEAQVQAIWPTELSDFKGNIDILVIYTNSLDLWYHLREDDPFDFIAEIKEKKSCAVVFQTRWFDILSLQIQKGVLEVADLNLEEFPRDEKDRLDVALPTLWKTIQDRRNK